MRIGRVNRRNVTELKGNGEGWRTGKGDLPEPRQNSCGSGSRGGLPDAAGVLGVHGLSDMASECFAKLVEVLHRAVDAPTAWRVRVDHGALASGLIGFVLTPDLGKSEEVPLLFGVAVDLVVDGFAVLGQDVEQSHVCDAQAAIVGGVFAEGQLAIELGLRDVAVGRSCFKAAVLGDFAIGALDELLAIFGSLPFTQVAVAVVLRAFVVKAVGHFVADDHADSTEVDGRIYVRIEERGLKDAGGEVDVVHRGVVVGVHRRRRHAPLLLVDGLAQLVQVVVALKNGVAMRIANGVIALDDHCTVVAPLFGIADLVAIEGQLCFGSFLGIVGHPRQGLDVGGEGFFKRGDELVHAGLGFGREVLLDPVLADGFAEGAVGFGGALLPAWGRLFLAGECLTEEVEILVVVGLGQVGSGGVNRVPTQVCLPGVDRLGGDQFVQMP